MYTSWKPLNDECKVTVLGGLPLTSKFAVCRAEPENGIDYPYLDDVYLVDRNGRWAGWAENRMKDDDWELVHEQIWKYLKEG